MADIKGLVIDGNVLKTGGAGEDSFKEYYDLITNETGGLVTWNGSNWEQTSYFSAGFTFTVPMTIRSESEVSKLEVFLNSLRDKGNFVTEIPLLVIDERNNSISRGVYPGYKVDSDTYDFYVPIAPGSYSAKVVWGNETHDFQFNVSYVSPPVPAA